MPRLSPPPRRLRLRGQAVLVAVLVLALLSGLWALGMVAVPAAAWRDADLRRTALQAQAAADSGLALAVAALNQPPLAMAGREAVCLDPQSRFPRSWVPADLSRPAAPAASGSPATSAPPSRVLHCVAGDASRPGSGWDCRCEAQGGGALPDARAGLATGGAATAAGDPGPPRARLQVVVRPMPPVDALAGPAELTVQALGCVGTDRGCGAVSRSDTSAPVARRLDLRAVPALSHGPASGWTAGGSIHAEALGAVGDRDPSGGSDLLAHAGGELRIGPPGPEPFARSRPGWPQAPDRADRSPGGLGPPLTAAGDAWLARAGPGDGVARRYLGRETGAWAAAPRVRTLDCREGRAAACTGPSSAGPGGGAIAVLGDWRPPPGARIGSPGQPVIAWVAGGLHLTGPAEIHGLLLARRIEVDARSGPVRWHGAAVSETDIVLHGNVGMVRDGPLLEALHALPIAWLPVPGRWRETPGAAGAAGFAGGAGP